MFVDELASFQHNNALELPTGEAITYDQLSTEVDRVGQSFGDKRKLIVMECRNDLATLVTYLACLRYRHVVILIPVFPNVKQYDEFIAAFRPNTVFKYENNARLRIEIDDTAVSLHPELCVLLATSGSTGSNKYVRLSRGNIQANAAAIAKYLALSAEEKPITTLPMHYSYGLSVINSHLLVGATLLLSDLSFFDRDFWDFFKTHQATSFSGVPFNYEVLDRLRFERMNLPSLRYFTQAGGKLSPELVEKFAKLAASQNIKFIVMYGQTEATARIAYVPPENLLDKVGSIGVSIPHGSLWLEDKDRSVIESSGVEGEIVYSGPNVMMGYATQKEDLATGSELSQLQTGDIGYFDDDGYFYITGRKSRIIKIYGVRVELDNLETILNNAGYDTVCCGQDNDLSIFSLQDGQTQGISRYLEQELGFRSTSYHIHKLSNVPRLANGKIDYTTLSGFQHKVPDS